jgi:hypothetical protein
MGWYPLVPVWRHLIDGVSRIGYTSTIKDTIATAVLGALVDDG